MMINQMKRLLCLIALFLSLTAFSQQDWELIYDPDSNINIGKVFVVDTDHSWGIDHNSIYYSDNWGEDWTVQYKNDEYYLVDLFFNEEGSGWAVGWSKAIHTDDFGATWLLQSVPNPLSLDFMCVYFLNPDTGWIAGSYRTIYVTYNGGENWSQLYGHSFVGHYTLNDIYFYDAMHGCAVGGDYNDPIIMTTSDGGVNWSIIFSVTNDQLMKVQYVDSLTVWSFDRDGVIIKSTDGGYTWSVLDTILFYYMDDMHFFDTLNAIAIRGGKCDITTDAWSTWEEYQLWGNNTVDNFSFCDDDHGIAVGNPGNMLRTDDGGYSWERLNDRFRNIAFFNHYNGWVIQVAMNRNFMHSDDGGFNWSEVQTGHIGTLFMMDFVSEELGFALTDESELLKTSDAGNTWIINNLSIGTDSINDMQFFDENTGVMCKQGGILLKTMNGGMTWESYRFDSTDYRYCLDFINPEEGWVGGALGFLGHTTDGGISWDTVHLSGYSILDVEFVDHKKGFASALNGYLFRTMDGGLTWEEHEIDITWPENLLFVDSLAGWICGHDEIYYTCDGGNIWQQVLDLGTTGSYGHLNDICAFNSDNVWACTEDGRVFACSELLGATTLPSLPPINIFPNPAKDFLNIEFNSQIVDDITMRIFSIDGKKRVEKQIPSTNSGRIAYDVSGFPGGMYFVNLQGAGISETYKVVVNH